MADKDTIDTTLASDEPETDTLDAAAQDAGSTESNSPYSFEKSQFPPLFHQHHEKPEKEGK